MLSDLTHDKNLDFEMICVSGRRSTSQDAFPAQ